MRCQQQSSSATYYEQPQQRNDGVNGSASSAFSAKLTSWKRPAATFIENDRTTPSRDDPKNADGEVRGRKEISPPLTALAQLFVFASRDEATMPCSSVAYTLFTATATPANHVCSSKNNNNALTLTKAASSYQQEANCCSSHGCDRMACEPPCDLINDDGSRNEIATEMSMPPIIPPRRYVAKKTSPPPIPPKMSCSMTSGERNSSRTLANGERHRETGLSSCRRQSADISSTTDLIAAGRPSCLTNTNAPLIKVSRTSHLPLTSVAKDAPSFAAQVYQNLADAKVADALSSGNAVSHVCKPSSVDDNSRNVVDANRLVENERTNNGLSGPDRTVDSERNALQQINGTTSVCERLRQLFDSSNAPKASVACPTHQQNIYPVAVERVPDSYATLRRSSRKSVQTDLKNRLMDLLFHSDERLACANTAAQTVKNRQGDHSFMAAVGHQPAASIAASNLLSDLRQKALHKSTPNLLKNLPPLSISMISDNCLLDDKSGRSPALSDSSRQIFDNYDCRGSANFNTFPKNSAAKYQKSLPNLNSPSNSTCKTSLGYASSPGDDLIENERASTVGAERGSFFDADIRCEEEPLSSSDEDCCEATMRPKFSSNETTRWPHVAQLPSETNSNSQLLVTVEPSTMPPYSSALLNSTGNFWPPNQQAFTRPSVSSQQHGAPLASPSAMELLFPSTALSAAPAVSAVSWSPTAKQPIGPSLTTGPATVASYGYQQPSNVAIELNRFFNSMGLDLAVIAALERTVSKQQAGGDAEEFCSQQFFSSVSSSLISGANSRGSVTTSGGESAISGEFCRAEKLTLRRKRGLSNEQLDRYAMTQANKSLSIVERNARVIKWIYACGKA